MASQQSPRSKTSDLRRIKDLSKRRTLSNALSLAAPLAAIKYASAWTISQHMGNPRKRTMESLAGTTTSLFTPKTSSFDVLWAGNFPEHIGIPVEIHTLILGTHPSVTSLKENKYFGHPMNAFWWIAGDCLGFRRDEGLTVAGNPYKFTSQLRYGPERTIPYSDQSYIFASQGFALWDVVKECRREGSLDSAIKGEIPNDIRGFCEEHPSIQRLVLANGGTACTIFNKHFKEWWASGNLKPGTNVESIKAFGKFSNYCRQMEPSQIECISAISVSPAAATYSYSQKRDFWEKYVYGPGLKKFEGQQSRGSPTFAEEI